MNERSDDFVDLSAEALGRKDDILRALQREAPRAAIRRRRRRRASATAVALLLVMTAYLALPGRPQSARVPGGAVVEAPETAPVDAPSRVAIAYVATDERIVDRLRLQVDRHPNVEVITDAELMQALADVGKPAGVARMGERVLLTQEVADASIGADVAPEEGAG